MDALAHPQGRSAEARPSDDGALLSARDGGPADAIAARFESHRPILTGVLVWWLGYVVLAAILVGLGLLLTHVLLPAGLGSFDDGVSRWFVDQRTSTLNAVTLVGSDLGSTPAIIGVAFVAVVVLAVGRHWRQIGFLICALSLEFTVFLTATLFVDRARPSVPRLDPSPVTSSYPSGHTAAALALYVGLAIVVTSLVRSVFVRAVVWILAIALPLFVGVSRLYRGMHHLTDVSASLVLGCGAILFALLATRATAAVADARDEASRHDRPRHELKEAA